MTSATPYLMFQDGHAGDAMAFYVSLFADGAVIEDRRYGREGPGPKGQVMIARFSVAGLDILCSDSFVKHAFDFTPSISLFVDCADEAELERLAQALGEGGRVLMPPGTYGFSRRFGWVNDRYGISWQLNLP